MLLCGNILGKQVSSWKKEITFCHLTSYCELKLENRDLRFFEFLFLLKSNVSLPEGQIGVWRIRFSRVKATTQEMRYLKSLFIFFYKMVAIEVHVGDVKILCRFDKSIQRRANFRFG